MYGYQWRWLAAAAGLAVAVVYSAAGLVEPAVRWPPAQVAAAAVECFALGVLVSTPPRTPPGRYARARARDGDRMDARRPPTPAERGAIAVLAAAARALAPWVDQFWAERAVAYTVAPTETVAGAFAAGRRRHYREEEVFLAERVFERDFAAALAVYLHELGHLFGDDGGRSFTDALTWLVEAAVRDPRLVEAHADQWAAARAAVLAERLPAGRPRPAAAAFPPHGLTAALEVPAAEPDA